MAKVLIIDDLACMVTSDHSSTVYSLEIAVVQHTPCGAWLLIALGFGAESERTVK